MVNWKDNPDISIISEHGHDPAAPAQRQLRSRGHVLSEHDEQDLVFGWAWSQVTGHKARKLYAIPNGQYRSGQRMEPGIRPGMPDMHLPVAVGDYHSLYIELKRADRSNRTTADQDQCIHELREEGNAVAIAYGHEEAIVAITEYLEG